MGNKKQTEQQVFEIWSTPEMEIMSIKENTLGATGPNFDESDNSIS